MDAGKLTAEQRARIQLKREQALARKSARLAASSGEGVAKLTVEQRARAQRSREVALARKAAKLAATRFEASCQQSSEQLSATSPAANPAANIASTEDQTSTEAAPSAPAHVANMTLTKHLTTSEATVPAAAASHHSITLIKDLTTTGAGARAWSLKVEVVRKDQELKPTRDGGKWFSAQLRDKTGEVRAAFFQQAALEGFEQLEQGHVFQISGGVAKEAASPNSGVQLTFSKLTLRAASFSTEELEDPLAWTFVTFGLSAAQQAAFFSGLRGSCCFKQGPAVRWSRHSYHLTFCCCFTIAIACIVSAMLRTHQGATACATLVGRCSAWCCNYTTCSSFLFCAKTVMMMLMLMMVVAEGCEGCDDLDLFARATKPKPWTSPDP